MEHNTTDIISPLHLVSNLFAREIAVLGHSAAFALPARPRTVHEILIMGRPKDQHYWNQVTKLEDGTLQCKHCDRKFSGGVSRIKAHIDPKLGQKGVSPCSKNPGSVPGSVGNSIIAGSSNPREAVNAVISPQVAGGAHPMVDTIIAGSRNHQNDTEFINYNQGRALVEDMISQINKLVDDLNRAEDEIKGELQWLESRGKKRKRQVDEWLKEAGNLKRRAGQMIEFLGQGRWIPEPEIQELTEDVQWHTEKRKLLVLSNELVGYSFDEYVRKTWELVGDDEVFIIGIHGMGGVGKTTLVTHIKNKITRKGTFNFKHVFWVHVSQDFSIFKLQDDIAKRMGVKLDEDDETIRAEILSSALEEKEKSMFILDDVWEYIDLHKVGIPLGVNGIKLILTSRLEHVCRQMDCRPNNIIRIEPLEDDEAWELFLLKLGYQGTPATLRPEVLEIARSVAKKCHGLPLGISVMARTMKGVIDIYRWRNALKELQNWAMGEEMEEKVFKVLKLSYDHLMDKNLQKCFLHCALYKEIEVENLIMNLVDEGLINGRKSLEEIFDEGRTILDKLVGHSLLWIDDPFSTGDDLFAQMNGLVRHMACHNILKESHMVKCGEGLTKIPHMQGWTADLEKVSLMKNEIKEIPEGTSPMCRRLSTLIFSANLLSRIPDSFFRYMSALAILDLSDNPLLEFLPNSVSYLRSLISLLLRGCKSLEYVPPLGELQALSRLVISGTSIKEVPQGLELLINLKWLDLSRNNNLKLEPGSVLPALTNMQYLDLRCELGYNFGSENVKVKSEDIQGMNMLECFAGSFHDSKPEDLSDYVRKILDRGCGPKAYDLNLGIGPRRYPPRKLIELETKIVNFGNCKEFAHLLPRHCVELYVAENMQWRCLCDVLSFNGPSSLRKSHIKDCPKLESLFCLSGSCSLCTHLENLESLYLYHLFSMAVVWKENDEDRTKYLHRGGMFSHLKKLEIWGCHKVEKLLTPGMLPQLQKLALIQVYFCDSLKEIFAVGSSEDNDDDNSTITLPKLTTLRLGYLPQLKTVCKGTLVCGSTDVLMIYECPNLQQPKVQVASV